MKSNPYSFKGKLFRYDFESHVVEYISKATEEMIADDLEWQEKYGHSLWDVDQEGYIVLSVAGLMVENWKKKAARDEYLEEWCFDLTSEEEQLASDFIQNEL